MQNRGDSIGSALFGEPERIGVERGIAEFRAGRPILIADKTEKLLVLPVDGIDAGQLAAFTALSAPASPELIITTRRARTLGLDVDEPVALELTTGTDLRTVLSLTAEARTESGLGVTPASAAARCALEIAKIALRLPAVLALKAGSTVKAAFEPPLVTVAADALPRFRQAATRALKIVGEARVPLAAGVGTRFVVFRDGIGTESVAVIVGEPDLSQPVPVRLHSACLTGDVFGSRRCDCGDQLKLALSRLAEIGGGVILYLDQEGRGLGLVNKMRAYTLQDAGLDTVDANITLGFDDDERDYRVAARMLEVLGCTRIRLLTNNPAKINGLVDSGIDIASRMPLVAPVNRDNHRYLAAKATRAGHSLGHLLETLKD